MDAVYTRMLSPDRRINKRMADLHDGISIGYRSYYDYKGIKWERAQRVNHLIPV